MEIINVLDGVLVIIRRSMYMYEYSMYNVHMYYYMYLVDSSSRVEQEVQNSIFILDLDR